MKKAKNVLLLALLFLSYTHSQAQTSIKILFDASKAETAGNADWVIDANTYNLGFGGGPAVAGQGSEANAQQIPSPAQSGITANTSESFWSGGLSYWGVDCVKKGYTVESLPYNGQITYNNSANPQDLSNYKVFIVCEPNIVFSAAEKTAIMNFVKNGGGLFMISDHDISDRNNDNWDSPHIWNDLMTNNSVQNNAFGMTFDYVNISQLSSNIPTLPNDSILHGVMGNVSKVQWFNGTTLTLNPTQNASVKGVAYKTGASFGNNNAMCAYARYGKGKVAALGDSSPCDDGSGDSGDQLYDGYITDASGNHQKLLMNITIWLATSNPTTATEESILTENDFQIFPNPNTEASLNIHYTLNKVSPISIQLIDATGRIMRHISYENQVNGTHNESFNVENLPSGIYFCSIRTAEGIQNKRVVIFH